MTVTNTTNRITYTGDGVNTVFSFPFPGVSPSDIQVFATPLGSIATLIDPSQYTLVLNAPVAPNPTGIGGTVTSKIGPVALGTLLTIVRTLPLTQTISLANQGALYQPVIESALDQLVMMLQQILGQGAQAIVVAPGDPPPAPLPPAATRAGQFFFFDSVGNPAVGPPGGAGAPVSTAMMPVVAAATIAQAVALLGLTGVTPEPVGVIKAWAGASTATPPTGYVLCGGQAIPRTGAGAALFALISTTFGAGDGSNTFNVPDLRGRVVAGLDNIGGIGAGLLSATTIPNAGGPTVLGGNGGAQTNLVSVQKMASHSHTFRGDALGNHAHLVRFSLTSLAGAGQQAIFGNQPPDNLDVPTDGASAGTPTGSNDATGGGNPLEIVQPTICLNYIIKL